MIEVNGHQIAHYNFSFELLPGLLQHKALEEVGEMKIVDIVLKDSQLTTSAMNETLANFCTLNIDDDKGLQKLVLGSTQFPEPLSTQVIE